MSKNRVKMDAYAFFKSCKLCFACSLDMHDILSESQGIYCLFLEVR